MNTVAASMPGELLQELVAVVGHDGYCALAWAFGGGKFYVPRWPVAANHPLVKALGQAKAEALCGHFAGSDIVLPLGPWRRRAVVEMAEKGLSGDEIARQLRISRSWVYEVIAEARRERGPDLFSQ